IRLPCCVSFESKPRDCSTTRELFCATETNRDTKALSSNSNVRDALALRVAMQPNLLASDDQYDARRVVDPLGALDVPPGDLVPNSPNGRSAHAELSSHGLLCSVAVADRPELEPRSSSSCR